MRRKLLTTLILAMLAINVLPASGQDIVSLLPRLDNLDGWKIHEGPDVYAGDDLFDLIDGGADIYFEYGFSQVVSADYYDPDQNITQAEIYEMTDASAAYGIFSLTQQLGEWNSDFGQLAVVNDNYIAFWKGKYYVNISWASREDASGKPMQKLAGMISASIKEPGAYPDLLSALKALEPGMKAVYLHGNLALSNFYYFDYKDIFEFREAIGCSSGTHHRLVFRYPDDTAAVRVFGSAKQSMITNKRFTDVSMVYQGFTCKDNKGNKILVSQVDRYIVVLVSLKEATALTPLMDEIIQKIENLQ